MYQESWYAQPKVNLLKGPLDINTNNVEVTQLGGGEMFHVREPRRTKTQMFQGNKQHFQSTRGHQNPLLSTQILTRHHDQRLPIVQFDTCLHMLMNSANTNRQRDKWYLF